MGFAVNGLGFVEFLDGSVKLGPDDGKCEQKLRMTMMDDSSENSFIDAL
jgi:hypothetical protein